MSSEIKPNRLKTEIKKLRIALWILTFSILTILILSLFLESKWLNPYLFFYVLFALIILHFIYVVIFIIYIKSRYPANSNQKIKDVIMILFLGIIGMWLWLPTKDELEQLIE